MASATRTDFGVLRRRERSAGTGGTRSARSGVARRSCGGATGREQAPGIRSSVFRPASPGTADPRPLARCRRIGSAPPTIAAKEAAGRN